MKDSCRRFRERFQPGARDPHRAECRDCSRFAEILESPASGESRRRLPASLRRRLLDIPRREVRCGDVDRLYQAALFRADPESGRGERDTAAMHHLTACSRCRNLYGTLQSALVPERRPLPARLARRLSSVARHPERLVPIWIRDTRYAAAACYLLTTLTLALAKDASAVLRETTETVSTTAVVWVDAGENRSVEAWEAVSSSLRTGLVESWNRATHYGERTERMLLDAFRTIESTTHGLLPDHDRSVKGESDGRSRDNGA